MDKSYLIAQFHWADLVICSHFREEKTPTYSRINTVNSRPSDGERANFMGFCVNVLFCFTF